jgi:hypothetical protein
MIAGRQDGRLAGRMEQCFSVGARKTKPSRRRSSRLLAPWRQEKWSFIFQALDATCSEVAHAQKSTVGPSFPLLLLEYIVHSGHVCLSTGRLEHDSPGMISLK